MDIDLGTDNGPKTESELKTDWAELPRPKSVGTTFAVSAKAGYCLWEYDGEGWLLKKDACKEGHVPSSPPSFPGRFRGQIRAVTAVVAEAAGGR